MAHLIPRDFWTYPRVPSAIEDIDDLLSLAQTETGNPLTIAEDENHVHIDAAIPGIDPDDVEVTYDRGMLWVRGETRIEEKEKKKKYYRRAAQAFSYRISVPGDVDPNAKPEAEIKNGMVMVTFPKATPAAPKKITIKKSKNDGKTKS